jgi:hypothetical protein
MRVHVFTSAAANYLPKVRALFASVRRVRPEWRLHLVLADRGEVTPADVGGDEVHGPAELGIPAWPVWVFTHSLIELATGVKAFALAKLLDRDDCDAAIYLDPDIEVFSDLADIVEALAAADILVTPHQTAPETTPAEVVRHEVCTAQYGIYNLGFLAVAARRQGLDFARWWRERLYHFCRDDIPNGIYTDQRWIDFAPSYFDRLRILRGSHLNVAPWNLATRPLAAGPDGPTVGGRPLGFLHFSAVDGGGFDGFRDDPVVSGLVADYLALTRGGAVAWGFGAFADGELISPEQRLVLRLRGDLQRSYPDPFASGEGTYQAWWRAQAPLEFPALFDPATRDAEVARLSAALSTGYVALPD